MRSLPWRICLTYSLPVYNVAILIRLWRVLCMRIYYACRLQNFASNFSCLSLIGTPGEIVPLLTLKQCHYICPRKCSNSRYKLKLRQQVLGCKICNLPQVEAQFDAICIANKIHVVWLFHLNVPVGKQDSKTHCWPPQSNPKIWSVGPNLYPSLRFQNSASACKQSWEYEVIRNPKLLMISLSR